MYTVARRVKSASKQHRVDSVSECCTRFSTPLASPRRQHEGSTTWSALEDKLPTHSTPTREKQESTQNLVKKFFSTPSPPSCIENGSLPTGWRRSGTARVYSPTHSVKSLPFTILFARFYTPFQHRIFQKLVIFSNSVYVVKITSFWKRLSPSQPSVTTHWALSRPL